MMLIGGLTILRLILGLVALAAGLIGLALIQRNDSLERRIRLYLAALFVGLSVNTLALTITRIGQLLGWQLHSLWLQGFVTTAAASEAIALTTFVLYLLGLINGVGNERLRKSG